MEKERIILGIDPGTTVMGYGLLRGVGKQVSLVTLGVIQLHKYSDHYLKLQHIFRRTTALIDEYHPDELAIEAPFFGKNVQSMLKLGRAQGVAMSAALARDMPVVEYAPREIKMAITGNGSASKEQVAAMLEKLIEMTQNSDFLDATDALAVALCHYYRTQNITSQPTVSTASKGKASSWSDFIVQNPNRISTK